MKKQRLSIINAHNTFCPPDWEWNHTEVTANRYVLWFIGAGSGTLQTIERTYDLHVGDCFLLDLSEPCHGRHTPDTPLNVPWILFDSDTKPELQLYRKIPEITLLYELIERSINYHINGNFQKSCQWLETALNFVEECDQQALTVETNFSQQLLIKQICEKIRQNPGVNYSVQKLADECHYSKRHFSRVFYQHTYQYPGEFIINTKIQAACSLLLISDYSINEISARLGYADQFHFSRQFREKTKMSPSKYRKL